MNLKLPHIPIIVGAKSLDVHINNNTINAIVGIAFKNTVIGYKKLYINLLK